MRWRTANNRRRSKRDREILARIRQRLIDRMIQSRRQSPEATGVYKCDECGNTKHFTGIDEHGYGGPEVCDFDEHQEDGAECTCLTELSQDFTVLGPDNDIDYKEFTGGGCDAEIGSYTSILCAVCGATIWEEEQLAA